MRLDTKLLTVNTKGEKLTEEQVLGSTPDFLSER